MDGNNNQEIHKFEPFFNFSSMNKSLSKISCRHSSDISHIHKGIGVCIQLIDFIYSRLLVRLYTYTYTYIYIYTIYIH